LSLGDGCAFQQFPEWNAAGCAREIRFDLVDVDCTVVLARRRREQRVGIAAFEGIALVTENRLQQRELFDQRFEDVREIGHGIVL
jgi:hypothetical protein